jgi:hypothetical protein
VNIFRDGLLVDVDVSFWSGAKHLTAEDLGMKEEDVAEAYKLGHKMLIPEDVVREFRRIEGRARAAVDDSSFPFPVGSAKFVPKRRFPKVLAKLKECQEDYNRLTADLIKNYDEYRSKMLPIYRDAAEKAYMSNQPETLVLGMDNNLLEEKESFVRNFLARIEACYPPASTLSARYALSWTVYEIAMPRMQEGDSDKIAADASNREIAEETYRTQIKEKMETFVNDVVKSLRSQTVEVCGRISKAITEGKVIRSRSIDSLKNFIEKFSDLNFIGDQQIETQIEELKKELDAHTSKEFDDDKDLQTELHRRLTVLTETAGNITDINSVTGEYRRKISW